MKKKSSIILVSILCLALLMPLNALASSPIVAQEQTDELMLQYMESLASGEEDLPSIEWVEETQKIYQQSIWN